MMDIVKNIVTTALQPKAVAIVLFALAQAGVTISTLGILNGNQNYKSTWKAIQIGAGVAIVAIAWALGTLGTINIRTFEGFYRTMCVGIFYVVAYIVLGFMIVELQRQKEERTYRGRRTAKK